MDRSARARLLSILVLAAFIANVFIPFFAVYNPSSAQAAEASEQSSLFGEKILICTEYGFKWVSWDELSQEGDEKPKPNKKHYECPLCYVSAHGLKDFLSVSKVIWTQDLFETQTIIYSSANDIAKFRYALAGYQTRAPPHLI